MRLQPFPDYQFLSSPKSFSRVMIKFSLPSVWWDMLHVQAFLFDMKCDNWVEKFLFHSWVYWSASIAYHWLSSEPCSQMSGWFFTAVLCHIVFDRHCFPWKRNCSCYWSFALQHTLTEDVREASWLLMEIGIGSSSGTATEWLFILEGGIPENPKKTKICSKDENQQQTRPINDAGPEFEPGPNSWEESFHLACSVF